MDMSPFDKQNWNAIFFQRGIKGDFASKYYCVIYYPDFVVLYSQENVLYSQEKNDNQN